MATCIVPETTAKASVGMGQILLARPPSILGSVLGSCVGVAFHCATNKIGVLAHIVLPETAGREGSPGKFADTAIPYMIDLLVKEGVLKRSVTAKIAGGANMFGAAKGPMMIGEHNIAAVIKAIEKENIKIIGEHLGGTKGRRVTLNSENGELLIEVVGSKSITL